MSPASSSLRSWVRPEMRRLTTLSAPVAAAQLASMGLGFVDTVMV